MTTDIKEGSRAGHYLVLSEIGRGGAGTVFHALDTRTNTNVALKLFRTSFKGKGIAAARFRNEIQTLSKLNQSSIVRLLDFGVLNDGRPYFVSELVVGHSLRRLKMGPKIAVQDAAEILFQIATALVYVHGQGVVHGDLTPGNVMLTSRGTLVLLDFGIATPVGATPLSNKGMSLGTPGYMAPETMQHRTRASAGDIFSLGVIGYELLSGNLPFGGTRVDDILSNILKRKPRSIRLNNRLVPKELATLVLRSLSTDPLRRPTAVDFSARLRELFPKPTPLSPPRLLDPPPSKLLPPTDKDQTTIDDDREPQDGVLGSPESVGVLLTTSGVGVGAYHEIRGDGFIGRGASCAIFLPSEMISRQHARIHIERDIIFIADCGSANGTRVNGAVLLHDTPVRLTHGDIVTIGDITLLFMQRHTRAGLEAQTRLALLNQIWGQLVTAAETATRDSMFVVNSELLLQTVLQEALGFRIERRVPPHRGIAGFLVEAPMLWIRHTRFPILFLPHEEDDPALVDKLAQYLQTNQLLGYFIVLISIGSLESTLHALRERINGSPYRYDFVVLGRAQIRVLVATNDPKRFVDMVVEQGTDPGSLSPYVIRGPVAENMFFGRELEVKLLTQSIGSKNIAVVAGRRMGKSSILLRVKRLLATDQHYSPVYLSCEDRTTWSEFLEMLDPEALDSIDDPRIFRTRLAALRNRGGGRTPLLLLDEVDALIEHDGARANYLSRAFRAAAHEGLCRFIFSGSRTLYRNLHDAESPFFNFCEELLLRPLDNTAVEAIVLKPMRQLGLQLSNPERLVDEILQLTSGHPNLVQTVCHELVTGNLDRRITSVQIERISADRDFQRGLVETVWSDATPFEKIVSLLMPGPTFTPGEIRSSARRRKLPEGTRLSAALDMLKLYSIVSRTGDEYSFVLKAFPSIVRQSHDVEELIATLQGLSG